MSMRFRGIRAMMILGSLSTGLAACGRINGSSLGAKATDSALPSSDAVRPTIARFSPGTVGENSASSVSSARLQLLRQVHVSAALAPSPEVRASYLSARSTALRSCLKARFNIDYTPHLLSADDLASVDLKRLSMFLFDDVGLAQTDGYSWTSQLGEGTAGATASDTLARTVGDDPTCPREADAAYPPSALPDPASVDSALYEQFAGDQALSGVRQLWADCMRLAGHDGLRSPASIPPPGTLAKPAEVALAVADVGCRASSGYREAKTSWFIVHVASWLASHPEIVAEASVESARMAKI